MHELYQVLGVRSVAAANEIKTAFRRLAKQLHPDLHPGDADSERRFQAVIRAYETLSDRQSRMAYDAGLKNQRLMRRWQFRANAMTVVAAFSLTVSVGLHWGVLSQAILRAAEDTARLASNESHTATSGKAEGISSSIQQASPQAVEERGEAVPNKRPEPNADPSSTLQDHASDNELVDGLAKSTTAGASPLQSLPLTDLDLTLDPGTETAGLQRSLQNARPGPHAEPSSALEGHASDNELMDGLPVKTSTTEEPSLKSLAFVDLEPALYPARETTAPQSSPTQAPNKAEGGSGTGWWVVLGSINVGEADSTTTPIAASVRRASSAAHRCGMGTFNDLSSRFRGFAPGYMVVVIGPFADKADAARSQQQVNRCISGTYVKYAQHFGE